MVVLMCTLRSRRPTAFMGRGFGARSCKDRGALPLAQGHGSPPIAGKQIDLKQWTRFQDVPKKVSGCKDTVEE